MKYEITYIVDDEAKSPKVEDIITATGATYTSTKKWGQRELAYPIADITKAYYFTGLIESPATQVNEIKAKLNFAAVALRYLIVKVENE